MGANFLQDFGKGVGDAFNGAVKAGEGAVDSVVHAGSDAQHAIDQATRNTLSLAGSGVNAHGRIVGPVADIFGADPFAFVLSVARQTSKASRELLVRVAQRTGKLSYVFPTPQGDRKVVASPPKNANANQLALTLALCALDSPGTMQEEAGRMANGLPVKPRGLSGYSVFPLTLNGGMARGIFGIDDAIVLGIVVPIIAAIAAAVLPGLIAAASGVISKVLNPGPSPEDQAKAVEAKKAADTQSTLITVGVVMVVLGLGGGAIYMAVRHKKKAA